MFEQQCRKSNSEAKLESWLRSICARGRVYARIHSTPNCAQHLYSAGADSTRGGYRVWIWWYCTHRTSFAHYDVFKKDCKTLHSEAYGSIFKIRTPEDPLRICWESTENILRPMLGICRDIQLAKTKTQGLEGLPASTALKMINI